MASAGSLCSVFWQQSPALYHNEWSDINMATLGMLPYQAGEQNGSSCHSYSITSTWNNVNAVAQGSTIKGCYHTTHPFTAAVISGRNPVLDLFHVDHQSCLSIQLFKNPLLVFYPFTSTEKWKLQAHLLYSSGFLPRPPTLFALGCQVTHTKMVSGGQLGKIQSNTDMLSNYHPLPFHILFISTVIAVGLMQWTFALSTEDGQWWLAILLHKVWILGCLNLFSEDFQGFTVVPRWKHIYV